MPYSDWGLKLMLKHGTYKLRNTNFLFKFDLDARKWLAVLVENASYVYGLLNSFMKSNHIKQLNTHYLPDFQTGRRTKLYLHPLLSHRPSSCSLLKTAWIILKIFNV